METSAKPDALAARHAELEQQIEMEMKRPMPDGSRIAELKKEKLLLKDEMQRAMVEKAC